MSSGVTSGAWFWPFVNSAGTGATDPFFDFFLGEFKRSGVPFSPFPLYAGRSLFSVVKWAFVEAWTYDRGRATGASKKLGSSVIESTRCPSRTRSSCGARRTEGAEEGLSSVPSFASSGIARSAIR